MAVMSKRDPPHKEIPLRVRLLARVIYAPSDSQALRFADSSGVSKYGVFDFFKGGKVVLSRGGLIPSR